MKCNHVHLKVRDLPGALTWMRNVWHVTADFASDRMASLPLGSFWLFLDSADEDSAATVGFATDDCDRDFSELVKRGAVAIEEPSDRSWGVRAAYLQGPGKLWFELEQTLE